MTTVLQPPRAANSAESARRTSLIAAASRAGAPGSRRALAAGRLPAARAALAECRLCAWDCGVNRLMGEPGVCRAGAPPRIHLAQWEMADELELIPTFAIALSGCDLRCAFCITGPQSWNPRAGEARSPVALARKAEAALADGVRTITILGGEPTLHLPFLVELVAALPEDAKLVLKTNGYSSALSRALLHGLFDVWCVDYKFGNDACAGRLARVPHYTATLRENLRWAAQHSDLIVRHLLMPGHLDCCWRPVADWLAESLPGTKVSLRAGFWPGWQSHRHAELRRTVSDADVARASAIAVERGLHLIE